MCLITVGLGWAQGFIGWLGGYVLFLVALSFIYLPTEWLTRRGEDLRQFGIGNGQLKSAVLQTLKVSVCILPLYVFGFQWWHGSDPSQFHSRSLMRWNEEVRESPLQKNLPLGEVRVYTQLDRVSWRWRLKPQEKQVYFKWVLPAESRVKWIGRSRGVKVNSPSGTSSSKQTQTIEIKGQQSGFLSALTDAQSFELSVSSSKIAKSSSNQRMQIKTGKEYRLLSNGNTSSSVLRTGALRTLQDSFPLHATRSFWWIIYLALVQFFLVALPEEIFYRGYLQTRLDRLIGKDSSVFGVDFNWSSALICSGLFALAHLMTIPHPARLAVFFPSLLFGWMRRAYGTTLAPALFHALCNVVAQVLWGLHQPSLL